VKDSRLGDEIGFSFFPKWRGYIYKKEEGGVFWIRGTVNIDGTSNTKITEFPMSDPSEYYVLAIDPLDSEPIAPISEFMP
jgi:hypothetical protein